jgi:modulator of FtsH protease HflK
MTLFFFIQPSYMRFMNEKEDNGKPAPMMNENKGPWDFGPDNGLDNGDVNPEKGDKGGGSSNSDGPKKPANPWEPEQISQQKARGPSLEELFRKGTGGGKGGGWSGLPPRANGKSWWPIIIGGLALVWIGWTSFHRIDSQEQGVVTLFGKYSRTVDAGIALTLPAPFEQMTKIDTQGIRRTTIGSPKASDDNLVLTKDESLIDMSYEVGWSIRDPERFLFQIDNPSRTVEEVAESAMRAAVANFTLTQAFGSGRGEIEVQVRQRMQAILDEYRSGIRVQRVTILQSDPPAEVNEAFREVNAAQQRRESYLNEARGYASRVTELAVGETAEFDKIYEQYKTAPEVTRRRLYYETMEQVLGKVDKTIVDSGSNVQPYLPLPELSKRRPAQLEEPVTVTGKK